MPRASTCLMALAGLLAGCSIGTANTIDFSGSFIFDTDVQFFIYQSATPGLVTVSTSSFADGGFAPMLALYDSTGARLFTADGPANNDCAVANQADVLGTGFCYDTQLSWDSLANVKYYVALTEYDNIALGSIPVNQPMNTWNTGTNFTYSPDFNFTSGAPFGPGCGQDGFCLNDGHPRGNGWAVTFTSDENLTVITPEPGPAFLLLSGLSLVGGRFLRVRSRRA